LSNKRLFQYSEALQNKNNPSIGFQAIGQKVAAPSESFPFSNHWNNRRNWWIFSPLG